MSELVDQVFDFWVQALEMQRKVFKGVVDMLTGPMYSVLDEAENATRSVTTHAAQAARATERVEMPGTVRARPES